jgi:hypothetical protein
MASRTRFLLIAAAIAGIACVVAGPTDAFAKKGTATRTVQAAASAPVVVPNNGPPADGIPRCFDSVLRYPYPPCY